MPISAIFSPAATPIKNEIAQILASLTGSAAMALLTVEGQRRFVVIDVSPPPPSPRNSPWLDEFWVPHRGEMIRISAGDIRLITAERDYMRLHLADGSYLLHQTIAELERSLDPAEFIRLHRSAIVRREHIVRFRYERSGLWAAQLADGRFVRVGRSYLANARAIAGR